MKKEELFDAFKTMFPTYATYVTEYKKIGSRALCLYMQFDPHSPEQTQLTFLYYDETNWQLGTKLWRKRPEYIKGSKKKEEQHPFIEKEFYLNFNNRELFMKGNRLIDYSEYVKNWIPFLRLVNNKDLESIILGCGMYNPTSLVFRNPSKSGLVALPVSRVMKDDFLAEVLKNEK